jgi:hypothetical protein
MSAGLPPFGEDLDRLRAIFDAYGGDPLRWPDAERAAALALLARSADARRLHAEALRLDAALDLLPARPPSPGLEDRIVTAAMLDGDARHAAVVRPIAGARGARRAPGRLGTAILAAVPMAAAAALALWLGHGQADKTTLTTRPAPAPAQVAGANSATIALADLGVYQVPGDALLATSVLDDAYDAEPLNGCADGELGCLQVEALPLEPLSRDGETVEEVRFLT